MAVFTGCTTETDSGSNGDNGQVTNPAENPSDSGNGGGSNTNPSNPETPKATCTITFDANGGTGEMNPQTAESGTKITLLENAFTKDGNIFAGWATSAGVGVSYSDKAKITLTGNITLYAKWGMTAANAAETIANLTEEGTHTVTVAGEISADDLSKLANAISGLAENVNVILDLGDTTGLTEIPKDFMSNQDENLAGIVIPASVTEIKSNFWFCSNLSVLKVAENNPAYKSVGNIIYTKDGQTLVLAARALTEATIPASVVTIGIFAFQTCEKLQKITFEQGSVLGTIEKSAFGDCLELADITFPTSLKSLGETAFTNCRTLTSVALPEGVKTIPTCTFLNCKSLAEVSLPSTLESIGNLAFYNMGLSTVKYNGTKSGWDNIQKGNYNDDLLNATIICTDGSITETVSLIKRLGEGEHTVTVTGEVSAEYLTKIANAISGLAENVNVILDLSDTTGAEEIQYYAFQNCTNLTGFVFPASVTEIGISAFENSGIESIVIPGTVKTICDKAFSNCSSLSALTIEDGVETIVLEAFSNCSALKDVTVPASVKKLDMYAFHCSGLETATVYAETVGDSVFQECGSLKKVIFGNGVKTIGDMVFDQCDALEEVELPATLESIGKDSFSGTITQFSTVKYSGTKAQWDALKDNGKISGGNEALDSATLICMGSDPKEVYAPADKAAAAIATLESGTKANRNICTVKITSREESDKDFLKEIGEKIESRYAEYVCINLDLSATSITEIPEKAFYGVSLLEITLPDSLDTIRMKAFKDDYKLKKIVIPDNVRIIEAEAFNGCLYLAEITLPASLTNIGEYAFDDCVSLKTVNYGGTVAEWNALKDDGKISSTGNDVLFNATIHCSDGDI